MSKEIKEGDILSIAWMVQGDAKNHEQFIAAIMNDSAVKRFEY